MFRTPLHRLKRPLLAYGVLELLIGIYCAFSAVGFSDSSPLIPFYRSLYGETGGGALPVARFLISFLLLLIPTTFMGATLPVLSQFLVRERASLGRTVGALYAINTFGAVAGAAATGFLLLPQLGKAQSNWVPSSAMLFWVVWQSAFGMKPLPSPTPADESQDVLKKNAVEEPPPPENQDPVSPLALKLAIITFGITGFAALATQIGWTRAISLATGSSTYAFSLIVSVFILGLSLGGAWGSRVAPRTPDPLALLGKVLLSIGLLSMVLTAILGLSPSSFFCCWRGEARPGGAGFFSFKRWASRC